MPSSGSGSPLAVFCSIGRVPMGVRAACAASTAGTVAIARSAIAVIVSDGLTPTFAGTAEPSHTRRLRYPNTR